MSSIVEDKAIMVNEDDWNEKFWKHKYVISLCAIGTCKFKVNADCLRDAIDEIVDYCEEHIPGWIMSDEDRKEEEHIDEYIYGGNHCLYLNIPYNEMHVEEV